MLGELSGHGLAPMDPIDPIDRKVWVPPGVAVNPPPGVAVILAGQVTLPAFMGLPLGMLCSGAGL